jgi:hypothetical protein
VAREYAELDGVTADGCAVLLAATAVREDDLDSRGWLSRIRSSEAKTTTTSEYGCAGGVNA